MLNSNTQKRESIDIIDLIQILKLYKTTILITITITTAISIAAAFLMTPIYRSISVAAPVENSPTSGAGSLLGNLSGAASIVGINLPSSDETASNIAFLQSRKLAQIFFDKYSVLPVLLQGKMEKYSDDKMSASARQKWDAYKIWSREILSVREDKDTGLIHISVDWEDPIIAHKWAQVIIELANKKLKEEKLETLTRRLNYLEQQLNQTNLSEVRNSIAELLTGVIQEIMLAKGTDEIAFKVIDPPVIPVEKHRPKRLLIIVLGVFSGAIIGMFFSLIHNSYKRQKEVL